MTKIETLILSKQNLFSLQDLATLWQAGNHRKVVELAKYYVRKKRILRIRKGLYSLGTNYSDLEMAQKLIPFSYISYHTALSIYGINYQFYNQIQLTSLVSKTLKVEDKVFVYHKVKSEVFYNPLGLIQKENYTIASVERAICETFLFSTRPSFDHLSGISGQELIKISKIYNNLNLEKKIQKLVKLYNL